MVYATHRIIRDCNEGFANLFGFQRSELIGNSFSRLYPGVADFVRIGEMWSQHMHGGQAYYDERIMAAADGRRFWCRVYGRSRHETDPMAEALYCFQQLKRPVSREAELLTDRQRQILALIAQGKTSAAIANEIGLSRRTVESHRARLMRTLELRNSAELIAWFSRMG